MNDQIWKFYASTNDTPLDERITVADYTTLLYNVRRQRNELRAEFNIVVKQLEQVRRECDNMGILWRDAIDQRDSTLEHLYWNIRAVLETAQITLTSPHPLWSDLNELMETMPTLEKQFGIANCWESIEAQR